MSQLNPDPIAHPADPVATGTQPADGYDDMTVEQLRGEVDRRDGLSVPSNAVKADIIAQLRRHDRDQGGQTV